MPSPRWRPRRTPDGDVWVHDHHPGIRVQPGPHIDDEGREWPGTTSSVWDAWMWTGTPDGQPAD